MIAVVLSTFALWCGKLTDLPPLVCDSDADIAAGRQPIRLFDSHANDEHVGIGDPSQSSTPTVRRFWPRPSRALRSVWGTDAFTRWTSALNAPPLNRFLDVRCQTNATRSEARSFADFRKCMTTAFSVRTRTTVFFLGILQIAGSANDLAARLPARSTGRRAARRF